MTTSVHLSAPQLGAGIDYITCTARSPYQAAALLDLGQDILRQEVGSGGIKKPWHWQGFAGHQAGGVATGFTGHATIVRASGATARECAAQLIECAENVSRLDVQITVRAGECGADHANRLYHGLLGVGRGRGRPVQRSLVTSTYTGDTMYIGRRVSDQFGRIYNKSAEEKLVEEPPRWRYEVEFKRKWALAAARSYASAAEKSSWCVGEVHNWFSKRSCPPPCSAVHSVGLRGDSRGSASQANRVAWLKHGVRPVVRQLAEEFGWPDVLALLGVPVGFSDRYVNETLCGEE